ncbi:MAG: hypothetical protein JNK23_01095 [Opitutaceae bacterium]|nr:hypothetical protein [Opitutaceae bacterium]
MKPFALLLAASLAANAAFVAVFVTQSPSAPPAPAASAPLAASRGASADALRTALASGDAAALEAAGLSRDLARELALGRTIGRLADQARGGAPAGDGRWWTNRHAAATREAQAAARRQLSAALAAALGIDLGLGADPAQFAFLPAAKRDQLRRITDDYDEMIAKFSASGLQLPSDRERLRLLRAERERDIAALLTPEEKLAYDLRTSPSAATVRNRYGDAIESEAEFQRVYALQKAFDEKYSREALVGRISPETLRARSEAERQLDADLRAAVGDDRYAALRRAADPDVRNLDSLVSRLSLPSTATDTILAARDTYAAASQRINADTSISVPERRTQIQALAERAKADVTRTLGTEAGTTYAQVSPWINHLSGGLAYSTQPQSNSPPGLGLGQQSVFPVLPAGVNAAAGTRQVIFNSDAAVDRPIGVPAQIMTFTTTDTVTTSAGGAPATNVTPPATPTQPAPKP